MSNNTKLQCLNFPDTQLAQAIEDSLQSVPQSISDQLVCCYLEDDDAQNRVVLRQLVNNNRHNHYVLISKQSGLAYLAWKANVLGFIHHNDTGNISTKTFLERLKKYPPKMEKVEEKLRINFKGGFDLVAIETICFCVGSGNYTEIYLNNGTKKCMSYPLSKIEKRLGEVPFLKRIGKSFIVNLNLIKKVQTEQLIFKGKTAITLKLSTTYIKRVKQNLLWY